MSGRACETCRGHGSTPHVSRKKTKHPIWWAPCKACQGVGVFPDVHSPVVVASSLTSGLHADVGIVGGGIGGAALALALQQRGISVRVFERDQDFAQRKQGYALTMQQGAIALARLGIAVTGTSSLSHTAFLPGGEVIGCYGRELESRKIVLKDDEAMIQTSHKTRHNIQIPRQRLRAMLVHRLNPDVVEWNSRYERFEEEEGCVGVHFANREPVRVRVLVGADGIFSPVRMQKFPGPEYNLKYLGVIVILGIVNRDFSVLHRRVTQTLDGETRIFTMPFTSSADPPEDFDLHRAAYFDQKRFPSQTETAMWQMSFKCTEEEAMALGRSGGEGLKREALRRCGSWHAPIPELLQSTFAGDITGYPAYDRDVVRDFSQGLGAHVTVLGDAAHPMSPFKGQGANQALVDAISLAKHLSTRFGPFRVTEAAAIAPVLREFESEMKIRAGDKVEGSRRAAEFLHSREALTVGNCVRSAASFERMRRDANALEAADESDRANAQKHFEGEGSAAE